MIKSILFRYLAYVSPTVVLKGRMVSIFFLKTQFIWTVAQNESISYILYTVLEEV